MKTFLPHPVRTALLAIALLALAGCTSMPENALQLPPQSSAARDLQTRHFDAIAEATLFTASTRVSQDLGFTLDESEGKLGFVSASRSLTSRRALNGSEVAKSVAWTVLLPTICGPFALYDAATGVKEPQVVRVSHVTSAAPGMTAGAAARVIAQRVVYRDEQHSKVTAVEPLNDPKFYEEFLNRLSKSAFLENQKNAL